MNGTLTLPYKPGKVRSYAVIKRNAGKEEPGFGVYESTASTSATVIAWFFNQLDAEAYAAWKGSLPPPPSRH